MYEQLWKSESKASKGDFGEIHVQASDLLENRLRPSPKLKYNK